jgi:hypothetical protein
VEPPLWRKPVKDDARPLRAPEMDLGRGLDLMSHITEGHARTCVGGVKGGRRASNLTHGPLTVRRKEGGSRGGKKPVSQSDPPQVTVHLSPVPNTDNHLLSGVTPLGVIDHSLLKPGLGRQGVAIKLAAKFGAPVLDPENGPELVRGLRHPCCPERLDQGIELRFRAYEIQGHRRHHIAPNHMEHARAVMGQHPPRGERRQRVLQGSRRTVEGRSAIVRERSGFRHRPQRLSQKGGSLRAYERHTANRGVDLFNPSEPRGKHLPEQGQKPFAGGAGAFDLKRSRLPLFNSKQAQLAQNAPLGGEHQRRGRFTALPPRPCCPTRLCRRNRVANLEGHGLGRHAPRNDTREHPAWRTPPNVEEKAMRTRHQNRPGSPMGCGLGGG